jgi:hypothetical protein
MTKSQVGDHVGDSQSPALKPHKVGLRSADNIARHLRAGSAPKAVQSAPISDLAYSLKFAPGKPVQPLTCKQTLWFSFFFDGTGNNLQADEGTLKHSNVAKLYRVHVEDDPKEGIYRFYIPGVGTYFRDVGDPGGTTLGLGTGKLGSERLEWALNRFDERLGPHLRRAQNPSNAITEVNVAAFGFSRGAALARAFINMFLESKCERAQGTEHWCLRSGGANVRIRFMGLFDTVASVGTPMSMNNTSVVGTAAGSVSFCIKYRLTDEDLADVTPTRLAFAAGARPGADPAAGNFDGHSSWGRLMRIPEMVEEVRHFVAAHEIRNSFPLDSVSFLERGIIKHPAHFYETVYPGVHSDIGGSYRPGEGGRSYSSTQKLGLIPLTHMYDHALASGVPMRPRTAWENLQKRDFAVLLEVQSNYNYYMSRVGVASSLGHIFNANMALYFAWRFRSIRRKLEGDLNESKNVEKSRLDFEADAMVEKRKIHGLEKENDAALKECSQIRGRRAHYMNSRFSAANFSETLKKYDSELRTSEEKQASIADLLLQAKARLDAIPNMSSFASMLEMYDQQLLSDVKEIRKSMVSDSKERGAKKRSDLRPHYLSLVEAYENEFIYKKGLADSKVIDFFDTYVHDSLPGFAKDATLPSDPRVIYIGGDEKLKFASVEGTVTQDAKASQYG